MLRSVEWENIRAQKFPLTPIALFESYTSTAESTVARHAAEIQRRQEWLSSAFAGDEDETQEQTVRVIASCADK